MSFSDARKVRGLYRAEVASARRISPNFVRVTLAGDDLERLPRHGFDHWVRLFLPHPSAPRTDFSSLPETFGVGGYVKYLRQKSDSRPVVRSYTIRAQRAREIDIDFVAHGDEGPAGSWAQRATAGEPVALIDQGRGFDLPDDAGFHLLVGDESALPAVLCILRDLPADATGLAIVEVPHIADAQDVVMPEGVELRWLVRSNPKTIPGRLALQELRDFSPPDPETVAAFIVGEQALATGGRRHLVSLGTPKPQIEFTGFWRVGRAAG